METNVRAYPVGIQSFQEIRGKGYLYVDKTQYIVKMMRLMSKYIFLSRPRRFGKSLLVDTFKCYFEGQRELFDGLALGEYEKEWTEYPVLRFDMSGAQYTDRERLLNELNDKLSYYEEIYGKRDTEISAGQRFKGLITRAYEKTGRQVVVLIDEYDYPMLEAVGDAKRTSEFRDIMQDFYAPLKPCDQYLKFVFLTGITKFSQMSIFSKLNNIKNISMLDDYAAICGITDEELHSQMNYDVNLVAQKYKVDNDTMYEMMKKNYDGYHFSAESPDIYNPYSLLNALQDRRIADYWFESGTPTFLIEKLNEFHVLPSEIGGKWASVKEFDAPTDNMVSVLPLLYQSGYVTIKEYDIDMDSYRLEIPNKEVRDGLMDVLLPYYVVDSNAARNIIKEAAYAFRHDDVDGALGQLKDFFSKLPYCDNTKYEGHYQQLLYVMLQIMGSVPTVETHTAAGRIDLAVRSNTTIYIIELKIKETARAALKQINDNDYAAFYKGEGLKIVKIGLRFDTKIGTIADWVIER